MAAPERDSPNAAPARAGAMLAPLMAGFTLSSVCIVLLVGWIRARDDGDAAGDDATPVAQEQTAVEPESWLAAGATPTAIDLDLAYDDARYEIAGSTAAEIFASIDRNAPSTAAGKAAGLTRMEGRSYDYVRDHGTGECYITHVHAMLGVTLPDLQTAWTMPEQVLERWTAYERSVDAHERQHVAIYRAAAERAVRRLEQQQPFPDKRSMERVFTEVWTAEMVVADEENDAFHRREVDATRMEREVLTNELARTERELDGAAARVAEFERAHPDLRMPADEARRYNEEATRLRTLRAERQRLAEDLAWLR